mmetsp:Transcript_87686/g.246340  ORF Transcript_87686/g.246340 Transcript_87686/m.246340 type:complete len:205 (-) Transcript_87686:970-1584(-)
MSTEGEVLAVLPHQEVVAELPIPGQDELANNARRLVPRHWERPVSTQGGAQALLVEECLDDTEPRLDHGFVLHLMGAATQLDAQLLTHAQHGRYSLQGDLPLGRQYVVAEVECNEQLEVTIGLRRGLDHPWLLGRGRRWRRWCERRMRNRWRWRRRESFWRQADRRRLVDWRNFRGGRARNRRGGELGLCLKLLVRRRKRDDRR